MTLQHVYKSITMDPENRWALERGWSPVYSAHREARILVVGQAPGQRAQLSETPWNDASGNNLRSWMGIDRQTFYNPKLVALVPMDFYFPGSKKRGDLPPRKGFAEKWHPPLLKNMPNIELTILVGQYAHAYYLGNLREKTLTETVRSFERFLPAYFPLVHPSPRNNIWMKKNPWFREVVVPRLGEMVRKILQ